MTVGANPITITMDTNPTPHTKIIAAINNPTLSHAIFADAHLITSHTLSVTSGPGSIRWATV